MGKITKRDLNKAFWGIQGVQLTDNYESLQSVGFMISIAPILKKLYGDDIEGLKKALKRHLIFFNSHVIGTNIILGLTIAMEEQTTEEEKDAVTSMKTGLMGPFAGLGDSMIKFTWLPICGSIGVSLALNGSILGPVLMFVLYNVVQQGMKYYGLQMGYYKGMEFLQSSRENNLISRILNIVNITGLMVVGGLIASSVKIVTPLTISAGDNVIEIQEMLNKVMPNFAGLLFTLFVYWILKKTNGKHTVSIILITMLASVLFTCFGIL
ncbi:MAG: PTS system mannose/fructose/sorbose family transporter subunit IID [Clostridium sp.]|nr:PTS system mannose/fructose/sorbose family transporter subunit IID [Clostridium sp.]